MPVHLRQGRPNGHSDGDGEGERRAFVNTGATTVDLARVRRAAAQAMTLIEVMIAGAVFAAGASAVLAATASYMNVVEHERKLAAAWRVLQSEAAQARSLSDAQPEWNNNSTSTVDDLGRPAATGFTVARRIEANTPYAGARRLTIEVKWQERSQSRSTTLVLQR